MKLSSIQKLDYVLEFFAVAIKDHKVRVENLHEAMLEKGYDKVSVNELPRIVKRLTGDKYVLLDGNEVTHTLGQYSSTYPQNQTYSLAFEGELFYQEGGYQGDINKRNSESARLETALKIEKRRNVRNNLLSGTIGAILGALIGLLGEPLKKQLRLDRPDSLNIRIVHDTIYKDVHLSKPDTSLRK